MNEGEAQRELGMEEIVAGLRGLGLGAGDRVMVHSSLKSFGRVKGGAETVIRALQAVLTVTGTLMMPTFNHNRPWRRGGEMVFDPLRTPTANGAIPETFWRMAEVFRSLNPTHAFACWGKDAERYVKHHHRTLTMGADSPLGLLARDGGMGLLLGVGYGPNTFHHVVESEMNVPCLGKRTEAYAVRLPDGRMVQGRTWGWRERACPINDRANYAPLMAPFERRGQIGACTATLFKLSDAETVIRRVLQEGLNGAPPCSRCDIRPRKTSYAVASDWDEAANAPRADSEAWQY